MLINSNSNIAFSQWQITGRLINMNKNNVKVGFIGCGKMASAIIKGVLSSGFLAPAQVIASEISEEFAKAQGEALGIKVFTDNKLVAKNSDVIFLATKPHFIKDVLKGIQAELNGKLVVSIAAGVSTKTIEDEIAQDLAVIRVMPNAPAMILEGMSGVVKGRFAKEEHLNFVVDLLSNIGKCLVIEESKIDILTAISGSGPAFFYQLINEIARAGEKLGMDYKDALELSIQTAIGSAKVMQASSLSAEDLISAVATKGGCTAVGVEYLENSNSKDMFFEMIKRTAEKSKGLG